MSKTPTKNPNLWSDSKLESEYIKVCRELKELIEIAKQVKAGTYDGPFKGYLNKKVLVSELKAKKDKVLSIEKYIERRNELLKKQNKPELSITFMRMKRN